MNGTTSARTDRGDIVIGWLTKLVVVTALVGLAVFGRVLGRRLGTLDGHRVVRTVVRLSVAGVGGAALAYVVAAAVTAAAGRGTPGTTLALAVALPVGGAFYLWVAARLRVREIRALAEMARSRVTGPAG